MNKIIEIKVEDKVASLVDNSQFVVCGNTDYEIHFEFSEEWQNESVKTALFVFGEDVVEKVFTGNVCEGVEIVNASLCRIGVYTGNVKTTTPACLNCRKSITDAAGGKVHTDPSEDIYNQIIEVVNQGFAKIDDFEQDIDGLLTDVDGLKRDVSTQSNSINNLQMDVSDVFAQLDGVRDDISQNSQGIRDLYGLTGWMSSDIGTNSYNISQNSQKISQNTKDIAEQTKRNDITDIRLANLEHHINPDYFYTDESVAYQKLVPADAAPYAQLNSVGGMTYKSKNLIPYPYTDGETKTHNGITFTVGADRGIKMAGTATDSASFMLSRELNLKHGEAYSTNLKFGGMIVLAYTDGNGTTRYWSSVLQAPLVWDSAYTLINLYIQINSGATVNETIYPMLNAGSSVLPYEPYGEMRDAKVTAIRNHGANLFNVNDVNALNQYDIKNLIIDKDSSSLSFTKATGALSSSFLWVFVYLKSGDYTMSGSVSSTDGKNGGFAILSENGGEIIFNHASSGMNTSFNIAKSNTYRVAIYTNYHSAVDVTYSYKNIMLNYGTVAVSYKPYHIPTEHALPTAITSLDGWGKGVAGYANTYDFENGTYTKYTNDGETLLQEPIITKVSTGFDPLIRVEGGGSLEFVNEYSKPAPSSITYLLQEGGV